MAPDLRLAVVDGAAVVLLVVLALTTGWRWWFPAAGWGVVARRQTRLARRAGDAEGPCQVSRTTSTGPVEQRPVTPAPRRDR